MTKKTNELVEQGRELSDAELERAVGGTGLQEASVAPGGLAPTGGADSLQMSAEEAQLLNVQMAMQRENTMYSSISNVLKTRHDTAKNSISNIR